MKHALQPIKCDEDFIASHTNLVQYIIL